MAMHPAQQRPSFPSDLTCARVAPRAALGVTCEVRQGTRAWQRVVLEDLSPTGFRILRLANPGIRQHFRQEGRLKRTRLNHQRIYGLMW